MTYKSNGKTYNVPDAEIDKLMDKLDISLSEACETYLVDHDLLTDSTVEEMTKKATKNRVTSTIHSAKGEKKPRKPREKKENPLKRTIIDVIFTSICDNLVEKDNVSVSNPEKYIDFTIENRSFTVNLVEHRAKK